MKVKVRGPRGRENYAVGIRIFCTWNYFLVMYSWVQRRAVTYTLSDVSEELRVSIFKVKREAACEGANSYRTSRRDPPPPPAKHSLTPSRFLFILKEDFIVVLGIGFMQCKTRPGMHEYPFLSHWSSSYFMDALGLFTVQCAR
jgi:hypothetical protein